MQRAPQFVTGAFEPHFHFLPEEEYGRALDAIVKACSDIMVTSHDGEQVFLGKRKVEPQPGWWYIGGRSRPGESPQQAAARNVRRELNLELPPSRFEVVGNYSLVWQMRAQAPADHGTADISTVHQLKISAEEASAVLLDEKEYCEARWFRAKEVLEGEFHPVLKQTLRDIRAKGAYLAMEQAVVGGVEDAEIARLARDLVARMAGAPTAPVDVTFDAAT
eukprot:CAMPEP_0117501566 /NCGR_PEP_ID=MMETSP0784-20121206/23366_1 /TAXON_ID=39447 /ORGANISM="" /LENGTH=219 /DNA_ID=CAMNT_0005296827 /DNA_START=65 /DNA_END=721 /DNA_ORIENTATION=+